MCHITIQTSQKPRHYIQIREVVHQLARLRIVMVVPRNLNNPRHIMVTVLFVGGGADPLQQVVEVLISNRKLLEQSIRLEEFETEV